MNIIFLFRWKLNHVIVVGRMAAERAVFRFITTSGSPVVFYLPYNFTLLNSNDLHNNLIINFILQLPVCMCLCLANDKKLFLYAGRMNAYYVHLSMVAFASSVKQMNLIFR